MTLTGLINLSMRVCQNLHMRLVSKETMQLVCAPETIIYKDHDVPQIMVGESGLSYLVFFLLFGFSSRVWRVGKVRGIN
jgi:hypothetical protein